MDEQFKSVHELIDSLYDDGKTKQELKERIYKDKSKEYKTTYIYTIICPCCYCEDEFSYPVELIEDDRIKIRIGCDKCRNEFYLLDQTLEINRLIEEV